MQITRRDFLKDMAFTAAIAGVPSWAIDLDEMPASVPWPWSPPNAIGQGNSIITTLNRIAFGPRPGDFESVQSIGVDAYIDEQLALDFRDVLGELLQKRLLDSDLAATFPNNKPFRFKGLFQG